MTHLGLQPPEDHVPHPDLEAVLGPAHCQPRAVIGQCYIQMLVSGWLLPVGAPGHVDHAVAVLLQHLALPELHQLRVKLPDDHRGVFAASCQIPGDQDTINGST